MRVADGTSSIAGIGAFLTFVAGFVAFVSGRAVVSEFRRTMIYDDAPAVTLDDGPEMGIIDQPIAKESAGAV